MNKVILLGRLTNDPSLTYSANNGTGVARFTLAIDREYNREETDFISCVAFGKTAEVISEYFVKGKPINLTGRIQTGSYETKEGEKRYTSDVIVETFNFIPTDNTTKEEPKQTYKKGRR